MDFYVYYEVGINIYVYLLGCLMISEKYRDL